MDVFSFDHLSSTEFEEFCYDLLHSLGFVNVNWRKGTGYSSSPADRGRDIECQLLHIGPGGRQYFVKWFVECKHYKEGVPPDKLSGALAWAQSERPDKLLIIVSNFLSNPAKDYLRNIEINNKPAFKIECWEKKDLETMTSTKAKLLMKYRISGDFPFLAIMHPVHLKYIKEVPMNTINYLFECIERLDTEKRDGLFSVAYDFIIRPRYREPITRNETMRDLLIDEMSYPAFKKKCYKIIASGEISQYVLTHFIVSSVLNFAFAIGDTTNTDKAASAFLPMMKFHQYQMEIGRGDKEEHLRIVESYQRQIDETPQRIQRNYEHYVYLCEQFIDRLFAEPYLSNEELKQTLKTEEDAEEYEFAKEWFRNHLS
jgi:hypothetical protein